MTRAKELVEELSDADITAKAREISAAGAKPKQKKKKYDQVDLEQMSLFDTVSDQDILQELNEVDVSTMTPVEALNTIYRLQNRLRNRWQQNPGKEQAGKTNEKLYRQEKGADRYMKEIAVLDQSTIDKIAAGEVIERPASVVKELVENAVDAGANAITVEIRDGGTSFIRITDNGEGIDASQVPLAFLRHATSKIRHVEDLFSCFFSGISRRGSFQYCGGMPGGTHY